MHAATVLQTVLVPVFPRLDKRNFYNLITACRACLCGRRLTLMELARHWPGAMRVAAPLKRVDRLLSNRQMHSARFRIYQAVALWIIRQPQPVIIVDWSELTGDGRWQLLRASVALKGRSLTLYEEAHSQRVLSSPRVHKAFVKRLKALLPASCQPIVVTDAGFHTPWFREVEAAGWLWMGRVRGTIKACIVDDDKPLAPFLPVRDYFHGATRKAEALGQHRLTQRSAMPCWLVRVKRQAQGRHALRQRDRQRAGGGKTSHMARSQTEPWVLACSPELADYSPSRLVRLYGRRMQIEASFRDLKSHHFGCSFEDTQTRKGPRLEMLLLIHMLATLVAWLAGLASRHQHETQFKLSLLRRGWEQLRQSNQRLDARRRLPWGELRSMVASHA